MKKKRIISAVLAALVAFSAVSCGSKDESSSEKESSAAETTAEESTEPASEEETEAETETEPVTEEETEAPEQSSGEVDVLDYITSEQPRPPLWLVTDPSTGNSLYLMGTIHMIAPDTFPLPDYVMDIYENCDGIAVEYNIKALQDDPVQLMEFAQEFMYADGSTVRDHLKPETYEAAKQYLTSIKAYNAAYDYFCPSYWTTLMTTAMMKNMKNLITDGIDMNFIEMADEDGKEVVNIEELSTQIGVIKAYSDEYSDYMIAEMANSEDPLTELAETFGKLYNAWAAGDVDSMLQLENADYDDLPEEFREEAAESYKKLLAERNKVMADRAAEFIRNGDNLFYMVGSMHYAGDEGVIALLEGMGFTAERIS